MSKNIVEAYIEFNNQLIILISGLPGCGKLALAKNISRDFKITLLDQENYFIKDYDIMTEIKVEDNIYNVVNWYTDEAIDWDLLNKDIDLYKAKGVVVAGFSLPSDKITSKIDYHVHLNISKQQCLEKRSQCLEKYKQYDIVDKSVMNKLVYPYYLDSRSRSKIDNFVNITDLSDDQVYDIVFDIIINFIQQKVTSRKLPECKSVKITAELLDEPTNLYIS